MRIFSINLKKTPIGFYNQNNRKHKTNIFFLVINVIAAGLVEVIIYSSPDDNKKNRGFCFLEYESHKAASLAKRRLGTGRIKVNFLHLEIITFVRDC